MYLNRILIIEHATVYRRHMLQRTMQHVRTASTGSGT
jgi:hypothetical protein